MKPDPGTARRAAEMTGRRSRRPTLGLFNLGFFDVVTVGSSFFFLFAVGLPASLRPADLGDS